MRESPEQLQKHIKNLAEFEAKFGEYIAALEADNAAGEAAAVGAPDDSAPIGPARIMRVVNARYLAWRRRRTGR